jgi:hypothetical protein
LRITDRKSVKLHVSGGGPCITLQKKLNEVNKRLEEKLVWGNILSPRLYYAISLFKVIPPLASTNM